MDLQTSIQKICQRVCHIVQDHPNTHIKIWIESALTQSKHHLLQTSLQQQSEYIENESSSNVNINLRGTTAPTYAMYMHHTQHIHQSDNQYYRYICLHPSPNYILSNQRIIYEFKHISKSLDQTCLYIQVVEEMKKPPSSIVPELITVNHGFTFVPHDFAKTPDIGIDASTTIIELNHCISAPNFYELDQILNNSQVYTKKQTSIARLTQVLNPKRSWSSPLLQYQIQKIIQQITELIE